MNIRFRDLSTLLVITFFFVQQAHSAEQEPATLLKTTHIELHHRFDGAASSPSLAAQSAMLITLEHYSDQSYGDWFVFFDALGQHAGTYLKAAEIYFHIENRLSIPRIFGLGTSQGLIKDYYLVFRYNDADVSYINRAILVGVSVDLGLSQTFFWSLTAYLRKEDTQNWAPHFGTTWSKDFKIGAQSFVARGFIDLFRNDINWVLNSQPQLLWQIGHSTLYVGTEQQITSNFYGANTGWTWMPTLFIKYVF